VESGYVGLSEKWNAKLQSKGEKVGQNRTGESVFLLKLVNCEQNGTVIEEQ